MRETKEITYTGPDEYKSVFDRGINPRCGRELKYCTEGLGHAHMDEEPIDESLLEEGLFSDCCRADFNPIGFYVDDIPQERCLKCEKACEPIWYEKGQKAANTSVKRPTTLPMNGNDSLSGKKERITTLLKYDHDCLLCRVNRLFFDKRNKVIDLLKEYNHEQNDENLWENSRMSRAEGGAYYRNWAKKFMKACE